MEPKAGSETDSNELSANQPVMDWLVHCPETEMQGDRKGGIELGLAGWLLRGRLLRPQHPRRR